MTLRGSVASFPLETIVQLLAATAKTGQLEVRVAGESGTLGFAEGRLVSAVSGDDAGDPALGAVFAMADGDFEFVPWGEPPDANLAGDLNQLLDRAVVQRDKIVADRTIITDDRVRFALSDRAAAQGEVRLSADQWRALLAVDGERDLPAIAQQLRLGRLATLAMLADLVRAGIIEVKEAPPEPPPPPPDSGSSGVGGGTEAVASADAPPARTWGEPRAEAQPAEVQPAPLAAPAAPIWEEQPADASAATWDAPVPPPAEPERHRWDAPVEQTRTWQAPVTPTETERDWGVPAQDWERSAPAPGAAWAEPAQAEPARPDAALNDSLADRIAAIEGQDSATPAAPQTPAPGIEGIDERLSALSGVFDAPAAPPAWPAPEVPRAATFAAPPVAEPEPEAAPALEPKKKGGLFSGLFKKEETQDRALRPATVGQSAEPGTRVTKLAALANGLLDEFNNGQYGKGRLDSRIANLLMRVDEQADPIDRPLPIVDDRIDVATLQRASMSERQVAPYLALLITQIFEDAEHAFGKEKAKRGLKAVQAAVVGDPASLGTDLRLPRA